MRHEEPIFIKQYREAIKNPPFCCHTCDHYNASGQCTVFDMQPPKDFAEQLNACNSFSMEIPF